MKSAALLDNVKQILSEDKQANLVIPAILADLLCFEHGNLFQTINGSEFRLNFRLTKASVIELTCFITPQLKIDGRTSSMGYT